MLKTAVIVQFSYNSGPEFVFRTAFQQQGHAFPNPIQIDGCKAGGFGIPLRAVFNIHGYILYQAVPDHLRKQIRMSAVRIQFYRITKHAYLFCQNRKIFLKQRLAAGKSNAFKESFPFFQEGQQLLFVHHRRRGSVQKFCIMAKRAAHIAAPEKNCTCYPAGKIKQRHLLQSVYFQTAPLLTAMFPRSQVCNRPSSGCRSVQSEPSAATDFPEWPESAVLPCHSNRQDAL